MLIRVLLQLSQLFLEQLKVFLEIVLSHVQIAQLLRVVFVLVVQALELLLQVDEQLPILSRIVLHCPQLI